MRYYLVILFALIVFRAVAQPENTLIEKGNEAYRNNDYKTAADDYKKVLQASPGNVTAKFNLGNCLQKENDVANAIKEYDDLLGQTKDNGLKAKVLYNKGLALLHENNLDNAIDAFEQALTITPDDTDTRENLQKALNEKRQQNPQQKKQQNKQQPPKKDKQPNKQMMEQKFQQLQSQEKQLQKQLQKKPVDDQPGKDW